MNTLAVNERSSYEPRGIFKYATGRRGKRSGCARVGKLTLREFSDLSDWSAASFSREPRDESQVFAAARSRNNCKEVN